MSILDVAAATEERFQERLAERQLNLAGIRKRVILKIAAHTPELVAQRLKRLHANPHRVKELLVEKGLRFEAPGPAGAAER